MWTGDVLSAASFLITASWHGPIICSWLPATLPLLMDFLCPGMERSIFRNPWEGTAYCCCPQPCSVISVFIVSEASWPPPKGKAERSPVLASPWVARQLPMEPGFLHQQGDVCQVWQDWQDLWWKGLCRSLLITKGQIVVPVVNVISIIIKSTAMEEEKCYD